MSNVHFSPRFKYAWWFIVIVLVGILLYLRREAIVSGSAQAFDLGLLGIAAAIVLLPFFSEFTLLGVTLKREIEETKKEVKQEVRDAINVMRTEVQNAVNVNNRINPQFFLNSPPPDETLNALKEELLASLAKINKDLGIRNGHESLRSLMPAEDALLAFSSRYLLEAELRRIWKESFQQEAPRVSGRVLVGGLVQAGVLPSPVGKSIEEVFSVSTPAIHGEHPSQEQISFLKEVAPPLVATVKGIHIKEPLPSELIPKSRHLR